MSTVTPQGSIERTAVRCTEQGFTAAEKVQILTNIGAPGVDQVVVATGKVLTVSSTLTLTGTDGSTLNIGAGGTAMLAATPTGTTQALTTVAGAGVVNVTTLTTKLTSTGTDALTLADGVDGQLKAIVHIVDGGDATLTPTTKTGFTTIVFSAVGQSVLLQFFTTKGWMVLSNNGAAVS